MTISPADITLLENYLETNNFDSISELLETYDIITSSCKKIYAVLDTLEQTIELR